MTFSYAHNSYILLVIPMPASTRILRSKSINLTFVLSLALLAVSRLKVIKTFLKFYFFPTVNTVKWRKNGNGDIQWQDEHRLLLVRAVKHNRDIVNDEKQAVDKRNAWHRVLKEMTNHGMPESPGARYPTELIKKEWSRILEKYNSRLHANQTLSAVEYAVQRLIMKYGNTVKETPAILTTPKVSRKSPRLRSQARANTARSPETPIMTPSTILRHSSSVTRTPTMVRRTSTVTRTVGPRGNCVQYDDEMQIGPMTPNPSQLHNPVVMLTDVVRHSPANARHNIANQIAEKDLSYKTTLLRNEDEKMEYNREIFRKQLTLLDLQIQRAQIDLNSSSISIGRNSMA